MSWIGGGLGSLNRQPRVGWSVRAVTSSVKSAGPLKTLHPNTACPRAKSAVS